MKVEYEHVLDTTHRHVQKADERDQQIAQAGVRMREVLRLSMFAAGVWCTALVFVIGAVKCLNWVFGL